YNPPQLAPIVFVIDGVSADFPRHLLLIALHHSDTTRAMRYEAVVANKKGGAVGRVERTNLTMKNGIVEAPIPSDMETINQPAEYALIFRLFTSDNKLVGEQRKDFALPAPPVPSLVERASTALNTSPWLGWSLGGIAACLIGIWLVRTFVPRKRKPLPRPQNLEPVFIRTPMPVLSPSLVGVVAAGTAAALAAPSYLAAPSNPPALWPSGGDSPPGPRPSPAGLSAPTTAILEVTSGSGLGRQYTLTDAEMSIGRADDNDIVLVDSYASRKHARVAKLGDRYVWSDSSGVTEPTHINGNLVSAAHALSDGDSIEVGRTTLVFRRIQQKGPSAAETQRTAMASVTPPPGRPLLLVIGGVQHTVAPGMTIAAQELSGAGAGHVQATIAEVMPNPEDASIMGLRNLSGTPWTVTQPNGETVVIEDGRAVLLDDGVKIDFGGAEGSVQR
ncbi:MAG: hypothetical protein HW416_3266, partial [Chloroflexi bacterium]|nr:hypothetical protein [Chloroflexota bacterium]